MARPDLLDLAQFRQAGIRSAEVTRLEDGAPSAWSRDGLSGRLVEISGHAESAALTMAAGLILDAQRQGEPVAWIGRPDSTFYPPDLDRNGIDLASLAVVRVPDVNAAGRAADRLIRSGAFGLVILDLGAEARLPIAVQGRLVGLAQRHDTAVVCLTDKGDDAPSLGSMVSLRAEALRERQGEAAGELFRCKVRVLKDKKRGPGWDHEEIVRGPAGLR